jgi:hypothetical protein
MIRILIFPDGWDTPAFGVYFFWATLRRSRD